MTSKETRREKNKIKSDQKKKKWEWRRNGKCKVRREDDTSGKDKGQSSEGERL